MKLLCYNKYICKLFTFQRTTRGFWHYASQVQGDTKMWEILKCVVAAMYSWQHYGTGTLNYRQPRHLVIMDQRNGQQRAVTIKMFYKFGFLQCSRFLCHLVLLSTTFNPLTPRLNPSSQRCLTRFFNGDFVSWTVHFVKNGIRVKNQQMQKLFIQFINYVW
jgi:hypothetical protein